MKMTNVPSRPEQQRMQTSHSTRFFPSNLAADMAGAVVMPLFTLGCRFIEATFHSKFLVLPWALVAFFAPVLLATADMRYAALRRRELGGFFRPLTSPEDFRLFYIPAWKRMLVLFLSAGTSVIVLKALGVEL